MQCKLLHLTVVFLCRLCSLDTHAITTSDNDNCTVQRLSEEKWTAENFPNPVTDVEHCGRGCKPSRVCDPDNVVSHNEADQLDKLLAEESDEFILSSNCNDTSIYLFSIAIIRSLNTTNKSADVYTIGSSFVYTLHYQKMNSCNNNIVILLSKDNHMLWISVGESFQNVTTEDCIDRLESEFGRKLRRGDNVSSTLTHLIKRLRDIIQQKTCEKPEYTNPGIPSEALIAGIGVFIILVVHGAYMIRTDILRKKRALEPQKPKKKKKNYTLIVRRPSRASQRMARLSLAMSERRLSRQSSSVSEKLLSRESSQEDKTLSSSQSERRLSRLSSQDKRLSRQSSCEEKLIKCKEPNGIKKKDKDDEIDETDVKFVIIDENDIDCTEHHDVFEMKNI